MESQINWRKGDAIRLGKAVADFNKKIRELQKEEGKLYLPKTLKLSEVKQNITTRAELNRQLNSLKRFMKEGAEELYTTKAGEKITKWERAELGIQTGIAKKRYKAELNKLNTPLPGSKYSRAQMGSEKVRELEARLKNLDKLETTTGYDFALTKERIQSAGVSDYEMKKAIVFRENYIKDLEKYSNYENYDKLRKKLESITNPMSFYKLMSVNELTEDLTYQSDQVLSQEEFNVFLNDLGIETTDIQSTPLEIAKAENKAFEFQAKKYNENQKGG